VNLEDNLSYENFQAKNIYATPLPFEGVSLSSVIVEHERGLSLCLLTAQSLTTLEELKSLAEDIKLKLDAEFH